jgi:hypothetical protein
LGSSIPDPYSSRRAQLPTGSVDPQSSTVSREQVWTEETDADMDDVSSAQKITGIEDPKGKKKMAINLSSTSPLPVHAAPALHKATRNATAQLPSLESAKLTKIPQKEKHDALSPNADAVVTPSRTLLPSSARTAPLNYSSPFGEYRGL